MWYSLLISLQIKHYAGVTHNTVFLSLADAIDIVKTIVSVHKHMSINSMWRQVHLCNNSICVTPSFWVNVVWGTQNLWRSTRTNTVKHPFCINPSDVTCILQAITLRPDKMTLSDLQTCCWRFYRHWHEKIILNLCFKVRNAVYGRWWTPCMRFVLKICKPRFERITPDHDMLPAHFYIHHTQLYVPGGLL